MPKGLRIRLVIAFALAIVCFCASTLYSNSISRAIDARALGIADNAMPSIEHLATVRSELRRLESALSHYVVSRSPHDRDEVLTARAQVDEAFERYAEIPMLYEGEPAVAASLRGALSDVDRVLDEALVQVGTLDPRVLVDGVKPAVNRAAEALRAALDLNAAEAQDLARRIELGRRRATHVALLLDLLSTLFTVVAAYLTVRALGHYHRIVDERNRLAARRAEELEQFAGRVAHDILGPLSATRLALGHAERHSSDETTQRMLGRGQRAVARVSTIVDGLLTFARAGAQPEMGAITLVAPMMEALVAELEPTAAQQGVTLELAPVPPCAVRGNAGLHSSVVENLVRNALKYMGERPVRRVRLRVYTDAARVRVEVEDTGPGIPPSLLASLFDPHVRGKDASQPGIGLGLATVKRIVEAHGGRVGVESRLGEGSLFWYELPRADDGEARVGGEEQPSPPVHA